ncbi:Pentatricopeptide repeat-containing protein [Camellia lanceoleosa]|uniref:Pentatricopeptide repeat-containing protein n=1 Tax=Camellia lanceoleosa TaxID=1840588 RepID=A0ACC0FG28_9ERIC|nr:Pentatricopeptide repeat-containing protein [Camellia lanceoleosa]
MLSSSSSSSTVRANRIGLVWAFYDQIIEEDVVEPDVSTYTTMIKGFCTIAMVDDAKEVFDEMVCAPNLVTYNTIVNVLRKKGKPNEAVKHLKEMMKQMGCAPNFLSYNTVICSLCKAKGWIHKAKELVGDMLRDGHFIDATMYSCVVYGYCDSGDDEMAMRVFKEMIESKLDVGIYELKRGDFSLKFTN